MAHWSLVIVTDKNAYCTTALVQTDLRSDVRAFIVKNFR